MIVKNTEDSFLLVWNLIENTKETNNSLKDSFLNKENESNKVNKVAKEDELIMSNPVNKQIVELVIISVIEMIYTIQINEFLNEYYNMDEIKSKIYASKP